MAGGWGPPALDFSPIANLANTFFDAQDRTRKRRLEDLQLQAGDEWAKAVAGSLDSGPSAPAAPSAPMSLSSLGQPQAGKLPTFAGGQTRPMTMPASPELAEAIKEHATAAGIDPVDLATAISYETAGTFDPWKAGPRTQWGQHRGLIQWGEPQAKQYGVYEGMPVKEQVAAAVKYLQDRGVKPGMGLMDVYSAINAGSVGRYNASDANNGGAPGTVADKVNNQMAGHRQKAMALLGASPADAPAPGAQNAQFQIPGQAQPQAQAPAASAPPQVQIPAYIRQALQSPNPYVRQKAAEVAQKYIAQRQEMAVEQWKRQDQRAYEGQVREQTWSREDQIRAANQDREDRIREQTWTREDENRFRSLVREDEVWERNKTREDMVTLDRRDYDASLKQQEREANRFEILKGKNGTPIGMFDKVEQRMLSPEEAQQRGITPQQATQGEAPDFGDIAGIRKEVQGLPSYKAYAAAIPAYTSMVEASRRNDKMADLNLVYGLAKIMDPTSVVREGEMIMVNNAQGLDGQVLGLINSVNGGARLGDDVRAGLMREAQSRMNGFKQSFDADIGSYRGIAQRWRINEADVIPSVPGMPSFDPAQINSVNKGGQGGPNLLSPQPMATQGGAPVPSGVFNWQPGQGLVPAR